MPPGAFRAPRDREAEREGQRVEEQIDHEPHMIPGRHRLVQRPHQRLARRQILRRPECPVVAVPHALGDQFDIGLRRDHDEHREQDHRQQPPHAIEGEPPCPQPRDEEARCDARDEKQQRKAKGAERVHQRLDLRGEVRAFEVIRPADIQHAAVEKDQERERRHPQPIEEIFARTHPNLRRDCARRCAGATGSKARQILENRQNCRIWDRYADFGAVGGGAFSSFRPTASPREATLRQADGVVPITSRKPRLKVFTD